MTQLLDREEQTPISSGEDDARQFLSEIRRYPLLTPEEERELARRCAEGDEDAIRQMVNDGQADAILFERRFGFKGV